MKFLNDLDMNNNRIRNLPTPLANDEPITLGYFASNAPTFIKVKYISNISQLPTAVSGNRTLASQTLYIFDGGTFTLSDTLTFDESGLWGAGRDRTILVYTGVGSFVNSTNKNVSISELEIQTSSGSVFNITNSSGTPRTRLNQINFRSCSSLGTIAGGSVRFSFVSILSCTNGLMLSSVNLGTISFNNLNAEALSGGANSYTIQVANGASATIFSCIASSFIVSSGHFGINIAGTFTLSVGGILKGDVFSGAGTRLNGVNGNSTNWNITFGDNVGIAGLRFLDIELPVSDSTLIGAGTFAEGAPNKALVLPVTSYDPLATNLMIKASVLFTTGGAIIQVGVRNHTSSAPLGGLGASVNGTNVIAESDYVTITGGSEFTAYYVKTGGVTATRKGLKLTIKTF